MTQIVLTEFNFGKMSCSSKKWKKSQYVISQYTTYRNVMIILYNYLGIMIISLCRFPPLTHTAGSWGSKTQQKNTQTYNLNSDLDRTPQLVPKSFKQHKNIICLFRLRLFIWRPLPSLLSSRLNFITTRLAHYRSIRLIWLHQGQKRSWHERIWEDKKGQSNLVTLWDQQGCLLSLGPERCCRLAPVPRSYTA